MSSLRNPGFLLFDLGFVPTNNIHSHMPNLKYRYYILNNIAEFTGHISANSLH